MLSWEASDRLLWSVVILTASLAYFYIPVTLDHFASVTEVPAAPETGPNKQLQKDAEKALSHETLRILSDGYSHDIRAATIKIVASRAVKSNTKHLLLQDLASKDGTRRGNAIAALKLLFYNKAVSDKNLASSFTDQYSLKAIITALENLLELHRPPPPSPFTNDTEVRPGSIPLSPVHPPYRPAHEKPLLMLLHEILCAPHPDPMLARTDIFDAALDAGMVTNWLRRYPFPCCFPENSRFGFSRSDICRLFTTQGWASDDPSMALVFQHICNNSHGVHDLRRVGLANDDDSIGYLRHTNVNRLIDDVRMVNGESTAGALTPPELRELLETARDDHHNRPVSGGFSREEESLRRRHNREAIVLAEAGAPLRRENILQRQNSLPPTNSTITTLRRRNNEMALLGNPTARTTTETLVGEERAEGEREEVIVDVLEDPLDDLGPVTRNEVPWDPRRQEIEGEAMVNESIRASHAQHENFLSRIIQQSRRRSSGDSAAPPSSDRRGSIDGS